MTRITASKSRTRSRLGRIGLGVLFSALFIGVLPGAAQAYYGHHYGYGHHGNGSHYGFYGHHAFYGHHYGYSGYSHRYYGPSRYEIARETRVRQAAGRGGLDLNVRPRTAQVYVDGTRHGRAGNLHGNPGYLWLAKGTHRVAIYKEGYLTVVQEYSIRPGIIKKVKFRLVRGKSVPPDEFAAQLGADGNR